jgi:AAA+ superfamily predicted ATPase
MPLFGRSSGERQREDGPPLPPWAAELKRRVARRGANFYILHGPGVRDTHPLGSRRWGSIRDFLTQVLFADRSAVLFYDRGAGIKFADREAEQDFRTVLKAVDQLQSTTLAQAVPRDPDRALQLMELFVRTSLNQHGGWSAAVVLDYGETLAPAGEPAHLSVEDRGSIVTLRRWASDPLFLKREVTFVLLAETLGTLNPALVSDARSIEIVVPVPGEEERYQYLINRGATPDTFSRLDARRAARLTGGLSRLHLESILAEAEAGGAPLDPEALAREKKRLIEESSGGLLEFVTSEVGLDAVAGHEGAKALLRETARALRQGRLDVVPMGYLVCGPVGTGKSFLVRCFAAEIGVPVVELRNFRSMWQGQTEANLERVLDILDGLGPVAVVIDEADAAMGSRDTPGHDSGVSERVFAALAGFMGDTRRRGRVIWFLMTSRPDLVPVDLKRQGRAEEHIALFPPATTEERVEVFEALRRRLKIPLAADVHPVRLFSDSHPMSAADLEAILVRAGRRMAAEGAPAVDHALLSELIRDFQPPAYPLEIEYQRLIAAMECTSRSLLPPDLAAMPNDAMAARLAEIRAALGR